MALHNHSSITLKGGQSSIVVLCTFFCFCFMVESNEKPEQAVSSTLKDLSLFSSKSFHSAAGGTVRLLHSKTQVAFGMKLAHLPAHIPKEREQQLYVVMRKNHMHQ